MRAVSYLGRPGSYSYQVAKILFPEDSPQGFNSFSEILVSVTEGGADTAVVPLENSITGRIPDVHRLMLSMSLEIVAEHILRIEHCLVVDGTLDLGKQGVKSVETLYSHSQGLLQCKQYLSEHFPAAALIETTDTARAVATVCEAGSAHVAAIASRAAAAVWGGQVVDADIADDKDNYTRFLVLRRPEDVEERSGDLTTLIFQVDHTPGALLRALQAFQIEGINITKLETYMTSRLAVSPTFYIDVGSGLLEPAMQAALSRLKRVASYVKLLGTYQPSHIRSMTSGFLPPNPPRSIPPGLP